MRRIALLDFDGYYWSAWHAGTDKDVSFAQQATLSYIATLKRDHDTVIVCVDRGPYKRTGRYPEYKAQRPKKDQQSLGVRQGTIDRLKQDGLVVLEQQGFEADDLIATAVLKLSVLDEETSVTVVSNDKDLLALVDYPGQAKVTVLRPSTGETLDSAAVIGRLGVEPEKVVQLLSLTGDTSDNIPGVKGVGPKRAVDILAKVSPAELIATFGGIYAAESPDISEPDALANATRLFEAWLVKLGFTLNQANAIADHVTSGGLKLALGLVTLDTTADVTTEMLFEQRQPEPLDTDGAFSEENSENMQTQDMEPPPAEIIPEAEPTQPSRREPSSVHPATYTAPRAEPARAQPQRAMVLSPATWTRELEPRTVDEAKQLARLAFNSRMFSVYGTVEVVYMIIMAGRNYNLDAVASLMGFHVVEGKIAMSAQLMKGLCEKHPDCEYFEIEEATSTRAVVECKRRSWRKEHRWEFTIEEAHQACLSFETKRGTPGMWSKYPKNMLVNRCIASAARFWFPDVLHGMYTADELSDGRVTEVS